MTVFNVLTSLAADIYVARDKVGRNLVGAIPAITINGDMSTRAAINDVIRSAITEPAPLNTTFAPSMTVPEGTAQTVSNLTMSLNKYASVQIPWQGEEQLHVDNGAGYQTVYGNQIYQAFNTIVNQMEKDVNTALVLGSGSGYGTSATTPFSSNLNDIPNIRKILVDKGCPDDGQLSLIYNTTAGVNLRNLSNLYKVNESGGEDLLRQGVLLDLYGMKIRESAQIQSHTAGSGTSYVLNGTHAVGATTITAKTGTGTILAGDIVLINGFKYVVATALASGSFTINGMVGLRSAGADGDTITVQATYTGNLALHRASAELAMRPIKMPYGGDIAADRMTVQDPWSGLVFELAVYKGYQKVMIEVGCLYGIGVWRPDFIATHQG